MNKHQVTTDPSVIAKSTLPARLASIDVFRALTMFLMIFVNDLWSLENVPKWLEHTSANEDGMGLSDAVFPAFLFIVGLSLPFAIQNRLKKGDSSFHLGYHILTRTIALLLMGLFHVNLENYSEAALLPKPIWQILITIGFFMVWLDYPKEGRKIKQYVWQGTGIALLFCLALLYKGGTLEEPTWFKTYWWGILGLIGWAYFIASTIFLLSKGKFAVQTVALVFFLLFNMAEHGGLLGFLSGIKPYVWIAGDGSMPAFVMAGAVVSMLYQRLASKGETQKFWLVLGGLALLMLAIGFATRPLWGISKIKATPSWTAICTGASMLVFGLLIYLVDVKEKLHWFKLIKPAGTSTLTAYLLPYIHYAAYTLVGITLPLFLRDGMVGILKSLLYALAIILITGLLEKWRLRLKI